MRSNRNTRLGLAAIAVALILLGIYAISRPRQTTTQPSNAPVDNGTPTEPVSTRNQSKMAVFARVNIPPRTILTPDMLEVRPLHEGLQGNFVRDIDNGALGYITRAPIVAGVPIPTSALLGHISQVGIAGALLPGRRAMMVAIANKATLHDLVRIGDRVDILAAVDQQESRTIVQNVRVLAVDVFGADYPQLKVAMRGDYKAPPRSVGAANPGSPPSNGAPIGPTNENAPPSATPTPQPTAPASKPEASLTLEVTTDQAQAISLAQAMGATIDFLLRPHDEAVLVSTNANGAAGGADTTTVEVVPASMTRARLAPYANRMKGGSTAAAPAAANNNRGNGNTGGSAGGRSRGSNFTQYPMPEGSFPSPSNVTPPAGINNAPVAPPTYDIPIYGDGKLMRTDTVRKPQD